jgi:cytochrome c
VLGRKAGSAEGFSYSTGLKDAGSGGLVWTEATLDKYLADPVGFVPRSKMAWAVRDEGQRRDLIAYIKTLR